MKWICFVFGFFFCSFKLFASIEAIFEPNPAQITEPLRLVITTEHATSIPDLTPLRDYFNINGTERSVRYTLINGQAKIKNQWIIWLRPKKSGLLTIPALKVGNEYTNPLSLRVKESLSRNEQASSFGSQEEMARLNIAIDNTKPYINEAVIYKIKIYTDGLLSNASFIPPTFSDGLLISLGKGKQYAAMDRGREVVVHELKYALFPQKRGLVKITPPSFEALAIEDMPHELHLKGEERQLEVKAIPVLFDPKEWLPARALTLSEHYHPGNAQELTEGSVIIRTVSLNASGLPAQLFPLLKIEDTKEFSVYIEKISEQNNLIQDSINGVATFKISYVLKKSGEIVIPAIKIPWFNTQTKERKEAILPATSFKVKTEAKILNAEQPVDQHEQVKENRSVRPTLAVPVRGKNSFSLSYGWIVAAAIACAWLATLLKSLLRQSVPFFKNYQSQKDSKRQLFYQIRSACWKNDPIATKTALLAWARKQWPTQKIINLNDLSNYFDEIKLKEQIEELAQIIYRPNIDFKAWEGHILWQLFYTALRLKKSKVKKSWELPSLYKN